MHILTKSLISWAALILFILSLVPYVLQTWNLHTHKKLLNIYKFLFKHHNLIGWIGISLALLHSLGWFLVFGLKTIVWLGLSSIICALAGAMFGYLYSQNKKKKIYIMLHGLLFTIGCIILSLHVCLGA